MIKRIFKDFIKRLLNFVAPYAHKISIQCLEYAVVWGRRFSQKRMKRGKLRSLCGRTPILTLPLLARCDEILGIKSQSLVYCTYVVTKDFDINLSRPREWILKNTPVFYYSFLNLVMAFALLRYDIFHFFCDRGILDPV